MKRLLTGALAAALAVAVGLALRGWSQRASRIEQKQSINVPRAIRNVTATGHAATRPAAPARADGPKFDGYKILLDKSMFVASRATASASPTSAPADATLSLKGISQEDARFTAFIEDSAAGRILEVKVGDALARGRVCAIHLTDVEYEADGKTVRVEVGQSLGEGVAVAATAQGSAPAQASAPPQAATDDAGPRPVVSPADDVQRTAIAKRR